LFLLGYDYCWEQDADEFECSPPQRTGQREFVDAHPASEHDGVAGQGGEVARWLSKLDTSCSVSPAGSTLLASRRRA
jgi:hypothetical protein